MSSYFGLDFGSSGIKVVKSMPMGANFHLQNIGYISNPLGSVDFIKHTKNKKLIDAIRSVLRESGIHDKRVVASVPESYVYSRVIEMPAMPDQELDSAIRWEAEQFVPLALDEVEMDYVVIKRPQKGSSNRKMLVYLVASRKTYLSAYVDFLVEAGLEPIALENEAIALARTFFTVKGVSLIVNLGALNTTISVLSSGDLMFTRVIPIGGIAITRALAQSLSLQLAQAEQYKITYGLKKNEFEGKVRDAILLVFSKVLDEITKSLEFYENTYNVQVDRIMLSGGGAYMPELMSFLSDKFQGLEVVISDPFAMAKQGKNNNLLPENRSLYGVAVGLSLRIF